MTRQSPDILSGGNTGVELSFSFFQSTPPFRVQFTLVPLHIKKFHPKWGSTKKKSSLVLLPFCATSGPNYHRATVRCHNAFTYRDKRFSELLELPSCRIPTRNTLIPSTYSSDMYTSTVQSAPPPLLMLHSLPTLTYKFLISRLPILYLIPLPPRHRSLLKAILLRLLPPLPPWLSQSSSLECLRSLSQEHWTTSLSFIPSCRPYMYSGIQL